MTKNTPNSGEKIDIGGRGPFKINPKNFFDILEKKCKIYRTFCYQVYPNWIKNKILGPDSGRSACNLVSQ